MRSNEHGRERSVLVGSAARILGAGAFATVVAVTAHAAEPGQADQIIQDWPDTSQKAAQAMIERYGQPDEASASMLVWENNDPWLRTIVYKQEIDHDFPMPHKDVLEQFIPYGVAPHMFDELAQYDGSVIAERTKGELSARCDKEAANFLAINLANDILQGDKSVEEARQEYGEAMKAVMAGNPPENTQGFTFEVPRDYDGDPGETIMDVAKK